MTTPSLLEQRIISELATLKRQIGELQQEQLTLERMLLKIRREGIAGANVARLDSVVRLVIEKELLNILAMREGKLVSTNALIKQAMSVDKALKPSTVRSYLNRMKARGLIENKRHGYWVLLEGQKDT